MRNLYSLVLGPIAVVLVPVPSWAKEEAPEPARLSLGVSLGLGSPLGYAGVNVAGSPVRFLTAHLGVGAGQNGGQVESGVRVRLRLSERVDFTPGASWSMGTYATANRDTGGTHPRTYYWHRAHFANLSLGIEARTRHVYFRPFVGAGLVLNGADAVVVNADTPTTRFVPSMLERSLLFVGLAADFPLL